MHFESQKCGKIRKVRQMKSIYWCQYSTSIRFGANLYHLRQNTITHEVQWCLWTAHQSTPPCCRYTQWV